MFIAFDNAGNRIKPSFTGQKAKCPLCDEVLIGKCGEIYAWHWQHKKDRNCDPWKEHETEWHRKWKAEFPDDWQEVIVESEGERHFADIKTPEGLVIEFQNSSISSSTIRLRENFYDNMIWIVNAGTFKNNFSIRSAVTSNLRQIEEYAYMSLDAMQDYKSEEINGIQEDLNTKSAEINDILKRTESKTLRIEKLKGYLDDKEKFTQSVISKWIKGEMYWDYDTKDITDKVSPNLKGQLQEIPQEIVRLKKEIENLEKRLLDLRNLETYQMDNIEYKVIDYSKLSSKSYQRVKAILKSSFRTLLPEIIDFKTESEFRTIEHRNQMYVFLVDPTNAINSYNQDIESRKNTIEILKKSIPPINKSISDDLVAELENKIKELNNEIGLDNNELEQLISQQSQLIKKQSNILSTREKDIAEARRLTERKLKENRSKVMREKKGLYYFTWKHERKSWQAAKTPIYFDIGESYLFERIRDGLFKKIPVTEFLEKHRNPIGHIK
jgi:competence CoiA-like predicted nuclease